MASANWSTADSLKCNAKTYSLEGGVVFNKKPEDSGTLHIQLQFIYCSDSSWILFAILRDMMHIV